jgi:hypothetical protein
MKRDLVSRFVEVDATKDELRLKLLALVLGVVHAPLSGFLAVAQFEEPHLVAQRGVPCPSCRPRGNETTLPVELRGYENRLDVGFL